MESTEINHRQKKKKKCKNDAFPKNVIIGKIEINDAKIITEKFNE